MTPTTANQKQLSSAENRRQLEESVERAMQRYKSDFEAVRANSARLREAREAQQADAEAREKVTPPAATPPRKRARKA